MKRQASSISSTLKSNSISIKESLEKSRPKSEKILNDNYEKLRLKYIDIIENNFIKKIPYDLKEEIDEFLISMNFKNIKQYFDYGIMSYIKILNILYLHKDRSKHLIEENIYKYDSYAARIYIDIILYLIELIQLNVLYVQEYNGRYFLSPLNDNDFKLYIRKFYKIQDFEYLYKKLSKTLKKNKEKYLTDTFNVNDYDFVLMYSYYGNMPINDFLIQLENFDKIRDYNSCILHSLYGKNFNHVISLQKCNNNNIINTTWSKYNNKKIDDFIPLEDKNYILNDKISNKSYLNSKFKVSKLSYRKTKKYDNYTYIYNTKLIPQYDITKYHIIYKNIYLFTNKSNKSKEYKTIQGGIYDITDSNCLNIFNTVNSDGFCWFSAIIGALCYSDKSAVIIYKKSERFIKKSIDFIKKFFINNDYSTLNLKSEKVLKTLHKNYIYLFLFIHSSFYLLSTDKINNSEYNISFKKFAKKMDLIHENIKIIFLYTSIIEYYSIFYDLPESYMDLWN